VGKALKKSVLLVLGQLSEACILFFRINRKPGCLKILINQRLIRVKHHRVINRVTSDFVALFNKLTFAGFLLGLNRRIKQIGMILRRTDRLVALRSLQRPEV